MDRLVIDYGSKMVKYILNGKEFICSNNDLDLDTFIEGIVDKYELCNGKELTILIGIDSKEYISKSRRLLNVNKQTTDDKSYKYKIQLFPSLVAIAIQNIDRLTEVYGILDIGYSNSRYAMFKQGKINRNTITTIDYGIGRLYSDISNMLKSEHNLSSSDEGIYQLLLSSGETKIAQMFNSYKFNYLDTLSNMIIEKNPAFTMIDNYVFGGGIEVLREQINIQNNLHYTENSLYDIVRGLDKIVHLV